MRRIVKAVLQRSGLFPFGRNLYRAVSPHHRTERRLRREFFAQLVKPGDLCFDIGANLGQTIEALLACGASVVALEPNSMCLPSLRYQFGRKTDVVIVSKAVGAAPGVAQLHFSGTASTASLRDDWPAGYDQTTPTEVTTVDQLIAAYGVPALLKVDVEGFETEVFRGLSRPISVIYFEVHRREFGAVGEILRRLSQIGTIEGVNAVSEDHGTWLLDSWLPADEFLSALPPSVLVCNAVVRMREPAP